MTVVEIPTFTGGSQLSPPLVDFVTYPPSPPSNGSPLPRYSVLALLPKATAPPATPGMLSLFAAHAGRGERQWPVFHRPPPDVRRYTMSGLVGWTRMVRSRPVSALVTWTP